MNDRRGLGTLPLFVAIAVAVISARAQAVADSGVAFFPSPPPSVPNRVSGLLVDFYIGMKAGQGRLSVSGSDRSFRFNVTYPFVANGLPIVCSIPPRFSATSPPPGTCDRWPGGIMIGKSRVTVRYFDRQNLLGDTVHVATSLTSL